GRRRGGGRAREGQDAAAPGARGGGRRADAGGHARGLHLERRRHRPAAQADPAERPGGGRAREDEGRARLRGRAEGDRVVAAVLRGRTFASLRKHRNYRLYFAGQVVSLSGTWMQDTALPWLVLQRTHSSVQVGLLLFCRYLPFTVFGLLAGVVDRADNRLLLMVTQAASMAVAAALAAVALSHAPLALVFVLAACGGTAVV